LRPRSLVQITIVERTGPRATVDTCAVTASSFYTPDGNTRAPAFGETNAERLHEVQLEGLEAVRL
jgi:hypothetical protein